MPKLQKQEHNRVLPYVDACPGRMESRIDYSDKYRDLQYEYRYAAVMAS